MKKYSLSILFLSALIVISLASCVKDKGFDENKYGLKDPNTNVAVSIPLAVSGISVVGVDYVNTNQDFNAFGVQLESENAATKDIHVNLVPNPSLVTAYNTANGTNLIALPTGSYSIPSLKVTIPAGSKTAYLKIAIPNASTLSPTSTYGLGFTIGSIDESGISIPDNMKNVVVQFGIKNKYDGKYNIRGFFVRTDAAGAAYNGPFAAKVEMQTSGASTVDMFYPTYGIVANPFIAGAFSNVGPRITFDLATNQVTTIYNLTGAGNPPMTLIGTTNRYDPATKTIYLQYYYNTDPTNRIFRDTLVYTGPR